MHIAPAESVPSSHHPARQVPLASIRLLSSGAATKPPMAPAEYSTDSAKDRRRTNQRANPACEANAAPVATPVPTSRPKQSIAPSAPVTTVAISSEPAMMSELPSTSVLRTPK